MKLTNLTARESTMSNVYIEPRPKGRPEGDPIDDYVVEDHADHLLATFKTQREAIEWAKKNGHTPLVARIRHLSDKKKLTTGVRRSEAVRNRKTNRVPGEETRRSM
jgi:hypothetical protein